VVVFDVRFVVVNMVATYAREFWARQRLFSPIGAQTRLPPRAGWRN